MNVLVTGGMGYIGSHTVVKLIEQGNKVTIVDDLSNSSINVLDKIEIITDIRPQFVQVNLLDYARLEQVFKDNKFDSVIHFAGFKAVGESVKIPLAYYNNNITGTLVLAELMSKYNVKNLVFSSSATVYGDPQSVPILESFPTSATNPYGSTKLFIEQILTDLYKSDNSFNIAILRYFNPVGAHKSGLIGENPNGIPNNLMPYISQIAIGKLECLNVFGSDYPTHDGTGVRDYIHVEDQAYGHLLALNKLQDNIGLVTYNLGTGNGYSVFDMIKAFEEANGITIPYKLTNRRAGDIAECYADTSLAFRELGFKAERGIIDMCRDSWNFQIKLGK